MSETGEQSTPRLAFWGEDEQAKRRFAFWRELEALLVRYDQGQALGIPAPVLTVYLLNCLSNLQSTIEAQACEQRRLAAEREVAG